MQPLRDLIAQVKKTYSQLQFALTVSTHNPQLEEMLEKVFRLAEKR